MVGWVGLKFKKGIFMKKILSLALCLAVAGAGVQKAKAVSTPGIAGGVFLVTDAMLTLLDLHKLYNTDENAAARKTLGRQNEGFLKWIVKYHKAEAASLLMGNAFKAGVVAGGVWLYCNKPQ